MKNLKKKTNYGELIERNRDKLIDLCMKIHDEAWENKGRDYYVAIKGNGEIVTWYVSEPHEQVIPDELWQIDMYILFCWDYSENATETDYGDKMIDIVTDWIDGDIWHGYKDYEDKDPKYIQDFDFTA